MENFKLKDKVSSIVVLVHNNVVCNVPKSHAVFRNRLLDDLFLLQENILRANINVGTIRNKYQKEALVNVSCIDSHLSILLDLSFIERKKFMSLCVKLNEIKKIIYVWMGSDK